MKKKLIFIFFLAVVGVIISTKMATAVYTVTTPSTGGGYGPYQTGQGGEFTLLPNSALSSVLGNYNSNALYQGGFQTFCLEKNEYIYSKTEHSATIDTGATKGGVGGATNGIDPISVGTAYLYYQFATGVLPSYNYGVGVTARKSSAAALQQAIWWLEDEQGDPGSTNIFRNYVLAQYTSSTTAKADLGSQFPTVRVLNLWEKNHPGDPNHLRQSQLVVVSPVPIPGALWLLGTGLVGLVGVRRIFAK